MKRKFHINYELLWFFTYLGRG